MLRKRNTDSAITADPPNNKVAAAHIEAVPKPELKEPRHTFAPSNCRTSAESPHRERPWHSQDHDRGLARKLLIALWRLVREGVVPDGVVLRPVS
jgi:hypothetical protein